jgi:hypothetical protein
MQSTDLEQFVKVLNGIAAIRKTTLTPEALDLWWACMADWDIADFKAAAVQVLKTSEFMPNPKDFEDLRKAGRPTAGEAWAEVLRLVRSGLPLESLPPTALSAVKCIGGRYPIAMHDEETLHFLERRFCEHFDAIQDRQEVRDAVPQIALPNVSKLVARLVR